MLTMYTSSFLKKVEANLLNANELLKDDDTFEAVVDDIFFFVMVQRERRRSRLKRRLDTKQEANVRSFLCLLFLLSHL